MAGIGDNKPPITVEFTQEEINFLVDNCNSNIGMGLAALQTVSRANAEKLVLLLENFKAIKTAIDKAKQNG